MRVVAEWVDRDALVEPLCQMGVHGLQGHAIHVPCPLADMLAEVARTPSV